MSTTRTSRPSSACKERPGIVAQATVRVGKFAEPRRRCDPISSRSPRLCSDSARRERKSSRRCETSVRTRWTSWRWASTFARAVGTSRSRSTFPRRCSRNCAWRASRWDSPTSPRVRSCGRRIAPVNFSWRRSFGNASGFRRGERTAEEGLLRIIDADGTYDSKLEPKVAPDLLKRAYRHLVLVRALDNRMLSLQRQGRIGFYVPSTGEEACQVGSAMALEKRDWDFPAYREPGAALWRGYSVETLIAQAYGNAKDPQQGRQMPNHYGARDINYVPVSSPVGTQIPQAVGAAWAAKIRKDDVVALTYFGDGATSEGDFHAGMNFAGVFKTPTIFFCKNNQWAISVPITRQTASKTLAQKAMAYGFDGVRVDGNDLLAVYAVTKAAADKARSGGGPTMIEAVTYRMGPHSSSDDPTPYRSKDEVGTWAKRDPVERMRQYLELKGLWSKEAEEKLRAEFEDLLQATIKEVERGPPPPIETLFTDVFAELTPQLKEQMEAFLASGERRRPEMLDKFPL